MSSKRKFSTLCSIVPMFPLSGSAFDPLIPAFKATFNVNIELIAFIVTLRMLPFAFLQLFSGTLSDIYDRQKILVIGGFIFSIGSLLCALTPNITVFSLSLIVQSMGSALFVPVAFALVGDISPKDRMGRAMGLYGVFINLGLSIGPLFAGFIASVDWRILYFFLFTYGLIGSILIRKVFRSNALDKNGSLKFTLHQFKEVFRNKNILLISATGFLLFFAYGGMLPLISDTLSLPPLSLKVDEIGILFSSGGFVGIILSFLGGSLVDKIGGKRTAILGFLVMLFPLSFLGFANSFLLFLVSLSILGGFSNLTWTPLRTLTMKSAPEKRGTAASVFNSARFFGYSSGPLVLAQIYLAIGINAIYLLSAFFIVICILLVFSVSIK